MLRSLEEARFPFAFTQRDTPELRARVSRDLAAVADRAQAADPRLEALILTGGFSRGEGTARGGRPLNDYDLVAVRSVPGGGARYRSLGHELSRRVGIEVDLLPVWRARLPRVGRKLFWLDLKLGGRVVAGDPAALDALRGFPPAALHPLEPARLLANRAAGLLLAVPGSGQAVDTEQCDLQSAKAALAAMDASLLAEGLYAARTKDRLALARSRRDHDIFARAVHWKLGGSERAVSWAEARDALLRAVDGTGARSAQDGWPERAAYAARARRSAWQPSATVRRAAWALLRAASFPDGPEPGEARRILSALGPARGATWPELKREFFALRARTLQ